MSYSQTLPRFYKIDYRAAILRLSFVLPCRDRWLVHLSNVPTSNNRTPQSPLRPLPQSFGQPRINEPPLQYLVRKWIKLFQRDQICLYHLLYDCALILQNTVLYDSLCIHRITKFEAVCNSRRLVKLAKLY